MTVFKFRVTSKAVRSRISRPFVADRVVDIATTKGIATPKAWGQAVTITATVLSNAKARSLLSKNQKKNVRIPAPRAINVSHLATLSARFWVLDLLACAS